MTTQLYNNLIGCIVLTGSVKHTDLTDTTVWYVIWHELYGWLISSLVSHHAIVKGGTKHISIKLKLLKVYSGISVSNVWWSIFK